MLTKRMAPDSSLLASLLFVLVLSAEMIDPSHLSAEQLWYKRGVAERQIVGSPHGV